LQKCWAFSLSGETVAGSPLPIQSPIGSG